MNYILAAILSNLSFALSDNVNGLLSKKNKPLQVTLWTSLISTVLFFIPAITIFSGELSKLTARSLFFMLFINLLINLGFLCFITGMQKGSITLTGVIGGSFPAVTTLVAIIFFGEKVSSLQLLAVTVVIIGVALSSMTGEAKNMLKDIKSSGTLFAVATFFLWGIYFALIRIPVEEIGWFLPQYTASIVGLILFFIIAKLGKNKKVLAKPKLLGLVLLTTLLGFAGSIFFNYAISKGQTAVVAPIAGSSPAVFVIFAYFIFHEKLNKKQWSGIALALTGIIGLSVLST